MFNPLDLQIRMTSQSVIENGTSTQKDELIRALTTNYLTVLATGRELILRDLRIGATTDGKLIDEMLE